jgi:serine protease inhibitor
VPVRGSLPRSEANFSPFSIRAALGMTYAGARGETAAQLRDVLHFPPGDEALHNAFRDIILQLAVGGAGKYEMEMANSLWGQEGAPLQTAYLGLIARYYGGAPNLVDFERDPFLFAIRHRKSGAILFLGRITDPTREF